MKIDIDRFKEKWENQYRGPGYGKVKIWVGSQKIIGTGSWKMTTIPWYLRWWYSLKIRRIYKKRKETS